MLPEEMAAADLIAKVTRAIVNPGPVPGRHDAELTLPSGRTIGLEVTRATDSTEEKTWDAVGKTRSSGDASLAGWWDVGLLSGANVRRARANLPTLLAELEALGEVEHNWLRNPHRVPSTNPKVAAVEAKLLALGVDHAVQAGKSCGGVSIVVHKSGGSVGGDDVVGSVVAEALKPDNVSKFAEMQTDESHIFVWVDYANRAAHAVLSGGILPLPEPTLPAGVDVLWIAARRSDQSGPDWLALNPHRWVPPGPWEPV